jgi:hypothetical protein
MFRLRPLLIAVSLACTSAPGILFAQVPYKAVTTTRVKVRSGPGEAYYATGILEADSQVTVVRDEKDGWLPIEPPEGSFSWVDGAFIRELSSTEGEVTAKDNLLVRIGTPFDPRKRDAYEKKLKQGDRVKILEKSTSGEGPLTKISYKIVPPPGDVRYVNAQFVKPVSGRRPAPRPPGGSSGSAPATSAPRDLSTEEKVPSPKPVPAESPDESPEEDEATPHTGSRGPQSTLERANAAYLEMMRRPLAERNIAAVRALYEQATQSAQTSAEHEFIAERLDSLQSQEERKAKFVEFDRALRRAKQRDEALLSIPRKNSKEDDADSAESKTGASPRYDASGTLRRSTAIIDGRPAYVLLSPQGGIRYYVTPSPGIDLNKYLDKIVAVRGPSSYRVEVRAQHITVRDVTVIELNQSSYREAKPDRGIR